MATSIITPSYNYTYNGKLTTDLFYKPTVDDYSLLDLFDVRTGIRSGEQLNLVSPLEDVLRLDPTCNPTYINGNSVISNRTLVTERISANLEFCASDFENTVMETLARSGVEYNDISGTAWNQAVDNVLTDALRRGIFNVAFFGDTTGGLAYNMFDGVWRLLIDNSGTGSSYCVRLIDSITTLNQSDGTRAIDYLRNLYTSAPTLLRSYARDRKVFMVTPNVLDNLQTYYENQSGADLAIRKTEEGTPEFTFRGIRIVPMMQWEDSLAKTANPFNGTFNVGIIYTTPDNHVLGVDDRSDELSIDGWYSKDDDVFRTRSRFHMGYNYIHCDLTAISYGQVSA